MKIKVCGMRDAENIQALLALQPDFIGFIFYDKSSRHVGEKIPKLEYGKTLKTGVFVNEDLDKLLDIAQNNHLDVIQLHGNESPAYCQIIQQKSYKVIKAFSIKQAADFKKCQDYINVSDYFLFDTKGPLPGGNGQTFDWSVLDQYQLNKAFLLSGGIKLSHLSEINKIKHSQIVGVDVNSGFEIAPAYKNINELKTFINEIRG
ncbi:MAG TPA: phosphoribosylanthranilate isomerase [Flavobacteriales bacterium]|nr:phosphoribosylanthranilate isomerase [Flavobacteriales bacterium]